MGRPKLFLCFVCCEEFKRSGGRRGEREERLEGLALLARQLGVGVARVWAAAEEFWSDEVFYCEGCGGWVGEILKGGDTEELELEVLRLQETLLEKLRELEGLKQSLETKVDKFRRVLRKDGGGRSPGEGRLRKGIPEKVRRLREAFLGGGGDLAGNEPEGPERDEDLLKRLADGFPGGFLVERGSLVSDEEGQKVTEEEFEVKEELEEEIKGDLDAVDFVNLQNCEMDSLEEVGEDPLETEDNVRSDLSCDGFGEEGNKLSEKDADSSSGSSEESEDEPLIKRKRTGVVKSRKVVSNSDSSSSDSSSSKSSSSGSSGSRSSSEKSSGESDEEIVTYPDIPDSPKKQRRGKNGRETLKTIPKPPRIKWRYEDVPAKMNDYDEFMGVLEVNSESPGTFKWKGVEVFTQSSGALECGVCNESFVPGKIPQANWKVTKQIRNHISLKHLHGFSCLLCSAEGKSTKLRYFRCLRNHMRRHKNRKTLHKCPICEKPYGDPQGDNFARHLWTHKSAEERVAAVAAGETEPRERRPVYIPRAPGEAARFLCSSCGKGFFSKAALEFHKSSHVEGERRKTVCPECGKLYWDYTLGFHMKRVHGERLPQKRFHCGKDSSACGCGKWFISPSELSAHVQRMTKTFKFNCEECGKGYATRSELNLHFSMGHGDLRQWGCGLCSKSYRRKAHLKRHKVERHLGLVDPETGDLIT